VCSQGGVSGAPRGVLRQPRGPPVRELREACVLRLLGEIAAQTDPPDLESAQEYYRRALARANELGMRPLLAHCHLGLGKLYRRLGNPKPAREHLATATTMYRGMGMTFWREKAEAAGAGGDP
jgi:hypothetical protein